MRIEKEHLKIEYPQIGEVLFTTSGLAKHIRIALKSTDVVRVTVPNGASVEQAMDFVESKMDWIIRTQSRMGIRENRSIIFTPDTVFAIKNKQLQLIPWKSAHFRVQLSKDALKIFYPNECDLQSQQAQEVIRDFIIRTIRKEAKEYLPQRIKHLASIHGFTYYGVTVKNLISRWGSCSAANHINLNIHLVRLPEQLSDYVILHELAHTIHKNHGESFWNYLDVLTEGKAKQLVAELKKYSVGL